MWEWATPGVGCRGMILEIYVVSNQVYLLTEVLATSVLQDSYFQRDLYKIILLSYYLPQNICTAASVISLMSIYTADISIASTLARNFEYLEPILPHFFATTSASEWRDFEIKTRTFIHFIGTHFAFWVQCDSCNLYLPECSDVQPKSFEINACGPIYSLFSVAHRCFFPCSDSERPNCQPTGWTWIGPC